MTKQDVFRRLRIEHLIDSLGVDWNQSQAQSPAQLDFLKESFLKEMAAEYLTNREILPVLLKAVRRLNDRPEALQLMWHFHWLVVQNYEKHWRLCYQFPELEILGEDARPFYLLLAFSGRHFFGDLHKRHGIPASDVKMAIRDFQISIEGSKERTGHYGLAGHYSGWWQGLFSGRLIRLGRLTFLQETYEAPARIFAHSKTGELCALMKADVPLTEDGLVNFSSDSGWKVTLNESADGISGHAISPAGYIERKAKTLSLSEWQELVQPHEPILGVHISTGSPLDINECEDSFAQAQAFHEKHFPTVKFRLFACESWLMDPSLGKVAKPESNIVQFQRRYHLLPSVRDLEFVSIRSIFGGEALKVGWENVPHSTSLQKRAAEFKRAGGVFRSAIGIYPMKKWGTPTH